MYSIILAINFIRININIIYFIYLLINFKSMSYTKDVVVYPELRPPVASLDGKSPLRGKRLTNIFRAHAQMGA